jgi:hypothetical protein
MRGDHRRHLIGRAAVLRQCGQWQCLEVFGSVRDRGSQQILWTPCGSVGSDWSLRIMANRQCLWQCGGSTWQGIGQSDVSDGPRASDHVDTADLQCFGSVGSGAPLTTEYLLRGTIPSTLRN